jgi:hypothetical protein
VRQEILRATHCPHLQSEIANLLAGIMFVPTNATSRLARASRLTVTIYKENRMKRALAILALGLMVGGSIVGCEANGSVGNPDDNNSSYKKTTTVHEPNGDTETKTTVKQY